MKFELYSYNVNDGEYRTEGEYETEYRLIAGDVIRHESIHYEVKEVMIVGKARNIALISEVDRKYPGIR